MSEDRPQPDAEGAPEQLSLRDAALGPPRRSIAEILETLPAAPGVYIMKDARGKAVYIGKAGVLRNRVRQYFQPSSSDDRQFVPLLEGIVADIETVVTTNEKEALLLENTLIKRHQPRFNVNLRDDKNYLVLRLDPAAPWPRLEVVRRVGDDGAYYFGPYHSATSAREALRIVNRHFQLRTCTDHVLENRRRPCLQHQIKRCPAPCVLEVSRDEYADQVRDVKLFLEGKNDELLDGLQLRMKEAAGQMEFERAAALRDQLRALEVTLERQRVVSTEFVDQDVFGFYREGLALEIAVLQVRQGNLQGSRTFSFTGQEFPDAELLSSFLGLYYDANPAPPDEVLLPFDIDDAVLKAEWLNDKRAGDGPVKSNASGRRRKAEILVPQRGPRRDLVELARKNAASSFVTRRNAREDAELALAKLQRRLKLPKLPRVIECYDISHIQGFATVASMVVFVDGRPEKSRYRTYKVRAAGPGERRNDDFASMYEVLSRRLRRAREGEEGWALPDLMVIDGGKGQLGMALAAARDVGIDVRPGLGLPIIALAKERELGAEPEQTDAQEVAVETPGARTPDRVFLPQVKDPILIRPNSGEMFVLQHLRDEAHRFAVTFHRGRRKKLTLRSALSSIPGIGVGRQRALLRHFGSVKKIREATVEELAAVPGMTAPAARAVAARLANEPPSTPAPVVAGGVEADQDAVESAFAALDDPDAEEEAPPPDAEI